MQGDVMMDSQDPFNLNNILRLGLQSREDDLLKLGRSADIYERLTASLAPSIWQMDDVKKGILCQLFGAAEKVCAHILVHAYRLNQSSMSATASSTALTCQGIDSVLQRPESLDSKQLKSALCVFDVRHLCALQGNSCCTLSMWWMERGW